MCQANFTTNVNWLKQAFIFCAPNGAMERILVDNWINLSEELYIRSPNNAERVTSCTVRTALRCLIAVTEMLKRYPLQRRKRWLGSNATQPNTVILQRAQLSLTKVNQSLILV